ncbi:MAG TPA: hypothetical protein VGJ73_12710, partial [Verrucomicrobiae bacterium]
MSNIHSRRHRCDHRNSGAKQANIEDDFHRVPPQINLNPPILTGRHTLLSYTINYNNPKSKLLLQCFR